MNKARSAAGLAAFTQGAGEATFEGLAQQDQVANTWKTICNGMQAVAPGYHKSTTFFYAQQTGETADCPAAVTYWKSGLTKFTGSLPPAYTNSTAVYMEPSFFGLVAMYNPSASPTVECAYVVCPITTTSTKAPSSSTATTPTTETTPSSTEPLSRGSQDEGPPTVQSRRLEAVSAFNALVCMTTPPAVVEGKEPFTKDQWTKIVGSISGSSGATLSLFSLVALAAITFALFKGF